MSATRTTTTEAAALRRAVLTMTLLEGHRTVAFDDVISLVASDATGQFGIAPGHADFVTVVEPGMFRYRRASTRDWTYAAGLGGLFACERAAAGTVVRIVSGRFLFGDQPEALQAQLDALLEREHALLLSTRESRTQLDLALVRRLQQLAKNQA